MWAFFGGGWIINLVYVVNKLMALDTISAVMEMSGYSLVQIFGVFLAPLGGVLGWVELLL